jgi:nucleotide-binding universal stress UspA family protein
MIDEVSSSPDIARCIPSDLVIDDSMLPDADGIGRIMSESNDLKTHEDLNTGFRIAPHFVDPDSRNIVVSPERTWLSEAGAEFRFLLYAPPNRRKQIHDYVQAFTELMQAHVDSFDPVKESCSIRSFIERAGRQPYDLLIVGNGKHSFPKSLWSSPVSRGLLPWLPSSLLIVREPKWPLKQILLILQHNKWDGKAVDWLVQLSERSEAVATVLTIVPSTSLMYQDVGKFAVGLPEILANDCALGQQIRWVSERLIVEGIEATFQLRQGIPEVQIQQELAEGNYDLCITGAEPHRGLKRFFLGEMVAPILNWTRNPVLVAQGL